MEVALKSLWLALVITWTAVANAGTPALVAHAAPAYTVSLPKGWTVVDNPSQGMVIAQQDPKKKDAAQLLVIVSMNAQASADQLLDAIVKSGLADAKVTRREALPDGASKLLVADGKAEGVAARLGAVAIASSGAAVICVLISKTGDFDALGGTSTVVAVLGSLKIGGAAARPDATPPKPAPPTDGARDPIMTPQYNASNSLVIPPLQRTLEVVDLVGQWDGNDGAGKAYYTSNGNFTGAFSALSTAETWTIDAKGNVKSTFKAARVTNGGAAGFAQTDTGTVTVSADNTMTFHFPAQNGHQAKTEGYIIVGWFVGPQMTLLKLQGPFSNGISAQDLKDAPSMSYRNHTFVTQRAHP